VPYTILEANSRRRAKTGCEKLWISIEVKASSTTKFGAEKKTEGRADRETEEVQDAGMKTPRFVAWE